MSKWRCMVYPAWEEYEVEVEAEDYYEAKELAEDIAFEKLYVVAEEVKEVEDE